MSIYFISGHCDISQEEFEIYYKEAIDQSIENGGSFVIGDARGVDTMAQEYLSSKGVTDVTIYHIAKSPKNNAANFPVIGGFKYHNQKDAAMTDNSDYDIAWVRSVEEQKKLYGSSYRKRKSGTEKNLNRRKKLSKQ
jgi:hypothetical protein